MADVLVVADDLTGANAAAAGFARAGLRSVTASAAQRGDVSDISAVTFHAALAEGEKPCDFFAAFNPVLVVGECVEGGVTDDLEVGVVAPTVDCEAIEAGQVAWVRIEQPGDVGRRPVLGDEPGRARSACGVG